MYINFLEFIYYKRQVQLNSTPHQLMFSHVCILLKFSLLVVHESRYLLRLFSFVMLQVQLPNIKSNFATRLTHRDGEPRITN